MTYARSRKALRPLVALFALQRIVRWPPLRNALSHLVRFFLPRVGGGGDRELTAKLRQDGFVFVDVIGTSEIDDIRRYLEEKYCRDRFLVGPAKFRAADAPTDCHVGEFLIEDVVKAPHVMRIANDPRVLALAGAYLGCKPTISNISIWWSFPTGNGPKEAEFFHRDVDDWRFLKLFVYLTDVDAESGPHMYVQGSRNEAKLLAIKRYTDEQVRSHFGDQRMIAFEGPAGTTFLEDTFGLHKGLPPVTRRRLLLQVEYSMLPIAVYDYPRFSASSISVPVDLDWYTNRLYVHKKQAGALST